MTFVGKILVIFTTVMSFLFMGFAMMVYTTRVDLRGQLKTAQDEIRKRDSEKSELTTKNADLAKKLEDEGNKLKKVVADNQAQTTQLENSIAQLQTEVERSRKEASESLTQLQVATTEQTQRRSEVEKLRETRDSLLTEKAQIVTQRTELQDKLAQTSNDLQLATKRGQELLDRLKAMESYVIQVTGSAPTEADLVTRGTVNPPPNVEGAVTKVDPTGKFIQLSLGSDDGIRKDQVLEVWRTSPQAKYLGQVKIFTVEGTSSVAKPVNVSGLIQEHDRVGPSIMVNRN